MLYICAEVYVNGQHGYRIVTDENFNGMNVKFMDVPDSTIKSLLESNRIDDIPNENSVLPMIVDGVAKSGKDIATALYSDLENVTVCYHNGLVQKFSCDDVIKCWNMHQVKYIDVVNQVRNAYIGIHDDYREFVDKALNGSINKAKILKSKTKLGLIGSDGTDLNDKGTFTANGLERCIIPAGTIEAKIVYCTEIISNSEDLKSIFIFGDFCKLDLSKSKKCTIIKHDISAVDKQNNTTVPIDINDFKLGTYPEVLDTYIRICGTDPYDFDFGDKLREVNITFGGNVRKVVCNRTQLTELNTTNKNMIAFNSGCGLEEIVLGGKIKKIGDNFLTYCYNLRKIDLGNTVRNLGKRFALNVYHLESLKGTNNLGVIAASCFGKTDNAYSLLMKDCGCRNITSIGSICFKEEKMETFKLPAKLRTLGGMPFENTKCLILNTALSDKSLEKLRFVLNGIDTVHCKTHRQYELLAPGNGRFVRNVILDRS